MPKDNHKPKICIITTIDLSLDKLFPDFYPFLISKGYEVVGICTEGPNFQFLQGQGIRMFGVTIKRSISPFSDLIALWKMYRYFRRKKITAVYTQRPKW